MDYYNYGAPNQIAWTTNPYYPTMPAQMNYQMPTYQPQQTHSPQPENRFVWVQGREGAKAYPTAPNSQILFLDDSEPYVYQKKTDKDGKTSEFKIFKLVEEKEPEPIITDSPFLSKDEFSKFQADITSSLNSIMQRLDQPRNYNKPYKGGNRNA